jgi:hypothetical protein
MELVDYLKINEKNIKLKLVITPQMDRLKAVRKKRILKPCFM